MGRFSKKKKLNHFLTLQFCLAKTGEKGVLKKKVAGSSGNSYLVFRAHKRIILFLEANPLLSKISPLYPNLSTYILHTVSYTFPKVLTRRICLTIKSSFSW